jgi:rifampicin phosphotransferase
MTLALVVALSLLYGMFAPAQADGLIPPLTGEQAAQARSILEGFKSNPRGPFYRIRWFCNDGTEHPPSPPPCRDLGGGYQHASLSPETLKLAEWNMDVGTILAGQNFDTLLDARRGHWRLKEIVLEHYLEGIDRGWIYRHAYTYRGARQAEDEEQAGYRFLTQLVADNGWVQRHYFLVTQLIGAMPHGLPDSVVKKVRNLAQSIAAQDPRFQPIRSKIHSAPGDGDVALVEKFLEEKPAGDATRELLLELTKLLEQEQAGRGMAARLPAFQKQFAESPVSPYVEQFAAALQAGDPNKSFSAGAELSFQIRRVVESSDKGRYNLELLDFNELVQELGFETSSKITATTRRERLATLLDYVRYAVGEGLLSMREFEALRADAEKLQAAKTAEPAAYYDAVRYLGRTSEWCRATAAKDFGPVARHYEPAEPLAAPLVDHLLRGSIALPLSSQMEVLNDDAHRAVGIRHTIFNVTSGSGVSALNPGVAIGRLRIIRSPEEAAGNIDASGIYVIPETVSDLKPMAGVLTLDSGNMLSHTQLLAANLGIPNARIPSSLLPELVAHEGKETFFAVTPRGVVILREKAALTPEQQKVWTDQPATAPARIRLDTSRLDLTKTEILKLGDLGRKDSGVIVGPKAANLGQLAQDFPGRVAQGLVLPFGIYYEHIQRTLPGDSTSLAEQIQQAYAQAERMRGQASPEQINAFIYPRLAAFREKIRNMPLIPEFQQRLIRRLQQDFEWPDGSLGVFVRSDTNAEDLPEFTGAGLNLTVPNQVGTQQIIQAIKNVWASPFTERAYDWRSRFLIGSEQVYPSVILMRAVPSDKSGVIGTVNLETGDPNEITVNDNEGVSAVVDGGVAESLLLKPDGSVRLLHQARASYRKQCSLSGGFENLPPVGGDYLLQPDEIAQIRALVAEVKSKYTPARSASGGPLPWDIEFGFEKGQLRLFQIRPLVRYQQLQTLEALAKIEAAEAVPPMTIVRLDEAP